MIPSRLADLPIASATIDHAYVYVILAGAFIGIVVVAMSLEHQDEFVAQFADRPIDEVRSLSYAEKRWLPRARGALGYLRWLHRSGHRTLLAFHLALRLGIGFAIAWPLLSPTFCETHRCDDDKAARARPASTVTSFEPPCPSPNSGALA